VPFCIISKSTVVVAANDQDTFFWCVRACVLGTFYSQKKKTTREEGKFMKPIVYFVLYITTFDGPK
jgi:hypothetical protein